MSLISPATNGYGNAIITVRYQASEPLAGDSLQLVFCRGTETQTVTKLLLSLQGDLYIKGNDLSNDGTQTINDTLTNGTQCTGARLIRLEIGGDEEAVKWLISENMNAPGNKDLPWQQDKPAYFTLGTTNVARTVYLWIQDRVGNISIVVSDSISLDIEAPQPPGIPTTNGQFFSGGTYTLNWDASIATSGVELYEVQEYLGAMTPAVDA